MDELDPIIFKHYKNNITGNIKSSIAKMQLTGMASHEK